MAIPPTAASAYRAPTGGDRGRRAPPSHDCTIATLLGEQQATLRAVGDEAGPRPEEQHRCELTSGEQTDGDAAVGQLQHERLGEEASASSRLHIERLAREEQAEVPHPEGAEGLAGEERDPPPHQPGRRGSCTVTLEDHRAVRAEPPTGAAHARQPGVRNLALAALATQLAPPRRARTTRAARDGRPKGHRRRCSSERAADSQPSILDERAALALRTRTRGPRA